MNIMRLTDPGGFNPPDLAQLSEKVSSALTRLCRSQGSGGNPFIYCFAAVKPHVIEDMPTAATDGKKYYWGVEFLRALTPSEVLVVLCHETYHVVLQHVNRLKVSPRDPKLWNLACDFWVNGLLKKEHHIAFGGNLGTPIKIADILKGVVPPIVDGRMSGCFVDETVLHMTVEEIYDLLNSSRDKIQSWSDKMSQAAKEAGLNGEDEVQVTLDSHINTKTDNSALAEEIKAALDSAKAMGIGKIPGGIEDMLGILENPQIPPSEWIKRFIMRKSNVTGLMNDYRRPRRRGFHIYNEQGDSVSNLFMPRRRGHKIRWVALVDTSGSMSNDDISYGVKELKTLASLGEGIFVPTDTQAYWDKATRIESVGDLSKSRIVGRGGTAFDSFFEELPRQPFVREGIEFVVIITDGYFSCKIHNPPADVVWIYTSKSAENPPFGKRINLY